MIVDLHTHTTASDGSLSPRELVARAVERDVELLAITDHDSIDAFSELGELPESLHLITGAEFSCNWDGVNIHVLGLGMDGQDPVLGQAMTAQQQARDCRAEEIDRRLAKKGISGMLAAIRESVKDRPVGRPDFARQMVASGAASSMSDAFDRYLGAGKVGDVKAMWPSLEAVVTWIRDAGGVAVVAHPLHYKMTNAKLRRLLTAFKACGGEGLEVCNGRPAETELLYLRELCRFFEFQASAGSDFHHLSQWSDLGCDSAVLGNCRPVWERWLAEQ